MPLGRLIFRGAQFWLGAGPRLGLIFHCHLPRSSPGFEAGRQAGRDAPAFRLQA